MRLRALLAISLALHSAGCFFYDSRWGQREEEQRRAAKRKAPAALAGSKAPPTGLARTAPSQLRTLAVRVHATPEYLAETVDWERELDEAISTANGTLAGLGVRLALGEKQLWRAEASKETLATLIVELRKHDGGDGADFVLGLVGSLPRIEFSFHHLGMADLLGKHLLVRAMNDAVEYKAIQEHLDELDERERHELYRSRKRHKNAAVLLHELGHALGALHVNDPEKLMNARYSAKADAFGPETEALLRIALRFPRYASDAKDESALIEETLRELEGRTDSDWVAGEREARIQAFQAWRAKATRGAAAPSKPAAPPPQAAREPSATDPTLSADDRRTYEQASAQLTAKQHREAWQLAEPLFTRYPKTLSVQDLRCKIATALWADWQKVRAECAPLMALTPGVPDSFRR